MLDSVFTVYNASLHSGFFPFNHLKESTLYIVQRLEQQLEKVTEIMGSIRIGNFTQV